MNHDSSEPDWVVRRLEAATALPRDEVARFVSAIHDIVDDFVTHDVTVIAPPLVMARQHCPVWERVRFVVKDEKWTPPVDNMDAAPEELAASLGLPVEVVERYPVVGTTMLLVHLLDELGVPDSAAKPYDGLLQLWLDTYGTEGGSRARQYRISPAGREEAFESWLETNIEVLRARGFPVRLATLQADGLVGRQPWLSPRLRADMICRFTGDGRSFVAGDWLVIENKTTAVDESTEAQLARYVDSLRQRGVAGAVHGLLIGDGRTIALERALRERSFAYLSLASLGYRTHLRGTPASSRVFDARAGSVPYVTTLALETDDGSAFAE